MYHLILSVGVNTAPRPILLEVRKELNEDRQSCPRINLGIVCLPCGGGSKRVAFFILSPPGVRKDSEVNRLRMPRAFGWLEHASRFRVRSLAERIQFNSCTPGSGFSSADLLPSILITQLIKISFPWLMLSSSQTLCDKRWKWFWYGIGGGRRYGLRKLSSRDYTKTTCDFNEKRMEDNLN